MVATLIALAAWQQRAPDLASQARQAIGSLQMADLGAAIGVLTVMITPVLLVSASGNLIFSTSSRLAAVVDRVRSLSDKFEQTMHAGHAAPHWPDERMHLLRQLQLLKLRAGLLQRTMTALYLSSGLFLATSVSLGLIAIFKAAVTFIPVLFGLTGAGSLFLGCMLLIWEARYSTRTLDAEMVWTMKLIEQHSEGPSEPADKHTGHAKHS